MAKFTFNLPDIGEGIAEAEIVDWHVKVGDTIEEDARLADMMTDKATVEMESPVAGKVLEVGGDVGDVVAIGGMLVVIEVEGELPDEGHDEQSDLAPAPKADTVEERIEVETSDASDADDAIARGESASKAAAPKPAEAPSSSSSQAPGKEKSSPPASSGRTVGEGSMSSAKVLASPAVRKRAKDMGVDLAQVHPAEQGRIRHADLDAFLSYSSGGGYSSAGSARADEQIKVVGLRRRIAENMAASKRHIPHFTYVEECDVTELEKLRGDLNEARGDKPKLTMLPLLIAAVCRTLPAFPMINARYDDEANVVTRHGSVHLGMATMTDAGLMVPVIRDAQAKNLWQLATEIVRLAEAAREGKAKSEELSGSTFTLSSLGPLGGITSTPVINRPEVAIIAPNRIVERPGFVPDGMGGERVEKRKLMNLSISCDHRVVDGYDAAAFVQQLKRMIEAPARILAG